MALDQSDSLVLTLPSTFEALERAVAQAQEFLASCMIAEELAHNVVLLASEAITNAMEHGNGWDAAKKVTFILRAAEDQVEVVVTDEGQGFDASRSRDPLQEANMLKDSGRGLFLMQQLADDVQYSDHGRAVRLVFRVPAG